MLVADDEVALAKAYARVLSAAGFKVEVAADGSQAVQLLESQRFDAIVSDIAMPKLDGIDLLRAVRARDLDVPVVLVTGSPSLETALQAVEFGAIRYLRKPIELAELLAAVEQAVRLGGLARLKREALAHLGDEGKLLGDRVGLELGFERALAGMWMAYQPLVHYAQRRVIGYEALLRSGERTLPHPGAIMDAAQRLGRLFEVGRAVRHHVGATLAKSPIPQAFVNLHPEDLCDPDLYDPSAPLSLVAHKVVLEITERASVDEIDGLQTKISRLRQMGFRLAIDDMGAGYAGLSSIAQLLPEVMKIDMSLVRDVDVDSTRQKLVGAMTKLCGEMDVLVVAEGIETRTERDTLARLGCNVMQGYLFAKPEPPFPEVKF